MQATADSTMQAPSMAPISSQSEPHVWEKSLHIQNLLAQYHRTTDVIDHLKSGLRSNENIDSLIAAHAYQVKLKKEIRTLSEIQRDTHEELGPDLLRWALVVLGVGLVAMHFALKLM